MYIFTFPLGIIIFLDAIFTNKIFLKVEWFTATGLRKTVIFAEILSNYLKVDKTDIILVSSEL